MKKSISIGSVFLFLILSTNAFAEYAKVKVNGIVCAFCAQGIKKKFSSESSVESVDVDLNAKIVKLKIKKSATISDEKIKELIKSAGYETTDIERIKGE